MPAQFERLAPQRRVIAFQVAGLHREGLKLLRARRGGIAGGQRLGRRCAKIVQPRRAARVQLRLRTQLAPRLRRLGQVQASFGIGDQRGKADEVIPGTGLHQQRECVIRRQAPVAQPARGLGQGERQALPRLARLLALLAQQCLGFLDERSILPHFKQALGRAHPGLQRPRILGESSGKLLVSRATGAG